MVSEGEGDSASVETNLDSYVVTYETKSESHGIPCYTVTNRRVGTVDLTVSKTWVDPETTEAESRPDATFSLECEEYPEAVTLSTDSTKGSVSIPSLPESESVTLATQFEVDKENKTSSYTFKNLPKYDIDGKVIHYNVTEKLGKSPEGSDSYASELISETYAPHGKSVDKDDQTMSFENTIYATTQAVFHKHWNDAYQNSLGHRPDIYLELWQKTSTDKEPVLTDYKPREWAKDSEDPTYNESCIFPNLPKYDENGEIIEYYASEHSVTDVTRFDYTAHSFSHPDAENYLIQADDGTKLLLNGGTFINGCERNIAISGAKHWENVPKGFIKEDLPIVTIHLQQRQQGGGEDDWVEIASVTSDNSKTEWKSGGYEFGFTIDQTNNGVDGDSGDPIPFYDENGALYEYRVQETFNKGSQSSSFDVAYENEPKINAFNVVNTFVSKKDKDNTKGSIMVDKYWDRSKLSDQDLPYPATTFVLTRAYESDTEGTLVKDDYFSLSKTLSPDDAARGGEKSRVEFTDLLRYAPNGKPYIYTVTEKSIDGYTTCVGTGTAEPTEEGNTVVVNSDALDDKTHETVSFKNSYETSKVNVTGTKLWDDYDNAFGIRPENIKIELHRKASAASGYSNEIADEIVVDANGDPLEPAWDKDSSTGSWTYTFENLDRYAPNGKAWQYQVVEIAAESDPDGFYGTEDQSTGWKTAGKTGDVVLNSISNKFDMQASVSKQWKGDGPNDDNVYGLRPTSVTVKLQVRDENGDWKDAADELGAGIGSGLSDIVLSSGNGWSHTFKNLPPAHMAGGTAVKYSYRVVETKLGDQEFEASVSDDGSYTFAEGDAKLNYQPSSTTSSTATSSSTTITNTMADSLVLSATKAWTKDLSNVFGTRPGNANENTWTITLTLQRSTDGSNWEDVQKAGSSETVTVTISGDNGSDQETAFEYLPRYDADGNTYQYRAVEEELGAYYKVDANDPDHYSYSYNPSAGEGEPSFNIKLTNEMITTNVSGTKEWTTFQDGVIPDPSAVKLTLYWNTPGGTRSKVPVQPEYTWTETDTDVWEYEFEKDVLPKYNAAGEPYTYTVVEPPVDGYNISYNGLTVRNKQALGSVTFTKKSTDGKLLAGARFELTHPDGHKETLTTDANGKVTLKNLKWGDYTVTEIESPEGYWFDKSDNALSILPFVSDNDYTKTFTINAQNCKKTVNLGSFENNATDIQFAKVDDEGKAVSGAKLQLTGRFAGSDEESSITWTSGNTPKNITAKMVVGETYTLSEAERTYGFRTLPGSVSFVMNDDGTITITQNAQLDGQDLASVDASGMKLTLTNKRILGGAQLTKTIDGEGNPLAHDAKFDLYRVGQSTPVKTNLATDSEGIIAVDGLGEGDYYFKETATIDGAILSTKKVSFSITEKQHAQTVHVSLDNKSTDLSIAKVDDNGDALAGAKLTLTGKFAGTSQTTYSWTSGDTPEQFTRKLIVGQEYELSEEGRVDGYRTLPGTVKFRIQNDGTIKITQNASYQGEGNLASVGNNGLQLNLTNSKILAHVQLAKTIDGEGGLAGVTFNLYEEGESTPLQEGLVTNEAGVILVENLPEGSYYFQETATVEGAILDTTKLPFSIEEKDHGKLISVGMDNRSTNVSILKTNDHGDALAGAKLQLTGRFAGDAEETTVDWTSGDAAKQFKGNLIVGEPYTLSETGRVTGHVTLPNPITFTVTAEGTITIDQNAEYKGAELASVSGDGLQLNLANPEIRASAQLTKYIDGADKLEGATFSVFQKGDDGDTLIEEGLVTDKNGLVKVDNLAEGKYYFVETATIEGAILDESHIDFEITESLDGTVVEETADNKSTQISIAKVVRDSAPGEGDPADGDPLPGAKLELTGRFAKTASDTISWTSTTEPKELVGELIVGETYTLTETERMEGYVHVPNEVKFRIQEDGTIVIAKNAKVNGEDLAELTEESVGLTLANVKVRGGAELTKTIDGDEPLEGAVFSLYRDGEEGPIATGLTTDGEGSVTVGNLSEGKYYFVETATVEGAILDASHIDFEITEKDHGKKVEAGADNASTEISILKANSDPNPDEGELADKAPLAGAKLQITGRFAGGGEASTYEWTSTEDAQQFSRKLIVGEKYTITEPERVDGYVSLPNPIVFKVTEQGTVEIVQNAEVEGAPLASVDEGGLGLTVANVKVRGSVELTKTIDGSEPLEGAVFDLYRDGAKEPIATNLVTDADGKIKIGNLAEGKYYFQETETVEGAILDTDPVTFQIAEGHHAKTVHADPDNKSTDISILKVSRDKVEGADDGALETDGGSKNADATTGQPAEGTPAEGEGNGSAGYEPQLADGNPLPGATLQLTGRFANDEQPSTIEWSTSDENPKAFKRQLVVGEEYTLQEIGRVSGYNAITEPVKFTILTDGSIDITENVIFDDEELAAITGDALGLTLANVKIRGNVQLTKTLAGEEPVEGITFSLYEEGAEEPIATDLITDANGVIQVNDLSEGSYYLQETATVPGAILNTQPQPFEITPEQHRQTVELSMDNAKTQISIAKIDQAGEPMEGVQLVLSGNFANTDETEIAWNSGIDPETFTGMLIVGEEYSLSEPARVPGYAALPNPVVFELNDLGQIEITQNANFAGIKLATVSEDDLTLSLANIQIRADVQLTKTLDGKTPLPDAVFDLYEEGSEEPLKTGLVTDEEGHIAVENLPEGSYYFLETEAPDEAVLNPNPIRFVIDESVHGTTVQVDADNKGFTSGISLKKVDSKTGKAIPGAQFTLYQVKANGSTVPVGSSLATNENGYVCFTVTEKGSYRIQETQAASGYKFDANKAFTASFIIDSDNLHGKTLKLDENSVKEAADYQLKVSNALYKDGNVANEPEESDSALKKALNRLAKTDDGAGGILAGLGALTTAALATLATAARKRRKSPESPLP